MGTIGQESQPVPTGETTSDVRVRLYKEALAAAEAMRMRADLEALRDPTMPRQSSES
jgi:hypothetical protein